MDINPSLIEKLIKNLLKQFFKTVETTIINLFKVRIRPTNLNATTEDENIRIAFDGIRYKSDVRSTIIGLKLKSPLKGF